MWGIQQSARMDGSLQSGEKNIAFSSTDTRRVDGVPLLPLIEEGSTCVKKLFNTFRD
jgi:hypothetical protein